jgi:glycine cleavage system H protein
MSEIPSDLKYTRDHEWVRTEDGHVRVGVTAHALEELHEIVYVDLPKVGAALSAHGTLAVLDSSKATSDVYSPVTGTVVEANGTLTADPETMNRDPYGDGWIALIRVSDPAELDGLLDAEGYAALLASEAH